MRVKTLGTGSAFGAQFHPTIADRLAPLAQDGHDIEGRAGTEPGQQQFHRPRPEVAAAGLGRPVDDHPVPAPGLADEQGIVDPTDGRAHVRARLRGSFRCDTFRLFFHTVISIL